MIIFIGRTSQHIGRLLQIIHTKLTDSKRQTVDIDLSTEEGDEANEVTVRLTREEALDWSAKLRWEANKIKTVKEKRKSKRIPDAYYLNVRETIHHHTTVGSGDLDWDRAMDAVIRIGKELKYDIPHTMDYLSTKYQRQFTDLWDLCEVLFLYYKEKGSAVTKWT